jgi:hypothetical protein
MASDLLALRRRLDRLAPPLPSTTEDSKLLADVRALIEKSDNLLRQSHELRKDVGRFIPVLGPFVFEPTSPHGSG